MNAYGLLPKVFQKIKEAQTPARFTQDFLSTKLGFKGGSARAFIPFAKRLGFLGSDGAPTETYRRFRNPSESGTAMAEAMRRGYAELFSRNEYANALPEKDLKGLVTEVTGLASDHDMVRAIAKSFSECSRFAEFDGLTRSESLVEENNDQIPSRRHDSQEVAYAPAFGVGLSYTINLNLPETSDVAVFDALFKSLRENLLKR